MKYFFIFLIFVQVAYAGIINIDGIDQKELDNMTKEFSANFTHSSVSPASALGKYFGIEVGATAGATKTPEMDRLVKEQDSSASLSAIGHAGILTRISIPFGFLLESSYFPEKSFGDVTIKNSSFAIIWSPTAMMDMKIPAALAFKAHTGKSELFFKQNISNTSTADVTVESKIIFETIVSGGSMILSFDFLIIEPYMGIGYLTARGQLDVEATGSATIFNQTLTTGQSMKSKLTSGHLFLGAQLSVFFGRLGFEYNNAFGSNRYTAKLSLAF